MTVQEAIDWLKVASAPFHNKDKRKEAIDIAIESMEKQIPQTPCIEGDGYADGHLVYDTWICPNCDAYYEIDYDDYDYCPKCGQKIDKSVMEGSEEE